MKVEVYRKLDDPQRRALYRSIAGYGYVIHKIAEDGSYFGEILAEQDLNKWRHFDIFCAPSGYSGGLQAQPTPVSGGEEGKGRTCFRRAVIPRSGQNRIRGGSMFRPPALL